MPPVDLIPTPPRRRWRKIRAELLPPLVFASTVFAIMTLWRECVVAPVSVAEGNNNEIQARERSTVVHTNLLATRFRDAAEPGSPLASAGEN